MTARERSRPHPGAAPGDAYQPDPRRWRALVVVLVAGFMVLLDVSIVNVALPSIAHGIGADDSDLQWVVERVRAGLRAGAGRRRPDRRRPRPASDAGARAGGLHAGQRRLRSGAEPDSCWWSPGCVQGLGGGLVTPQNSGLIQSLFRGDERGRAFGLFGAVVGVSTAIGPLLGGLLIQLGGAENGWRWIFLVNVPIGLVAIMLAYRTVPHVPRAKGERTDYDPVGAVAPGLATLLRAAAVRGEPHLAGRAQVDTARAGGAAGRRLRAAGSGHTGGAAGSRWSTWPCSPAGRTRSARRSGWPTSPGSPGCSSSTPSSCRRGSATARCRPGWPRRRSRSAAAVRPGSAARWSTGSAAGWSPPGWCWSSSGCSAAWAGDRAGVPGRRSAGRSPLPFLVAGVGNGLVISPNQTLTLSEVPPQQGGAAGGVLQTGQRLGSAAGIAAVGSLFYARLADTRGDFETAVRDGLLLIVVFIGVALAIAVADLVVNRAGGHR